MITLSLLEKLRDVRGHEVPVVAEVCGNHCGSVEVGVAMVRTFAAAGASAIKFQKRTPELAVPVDQADRLVNTLAGRRRYLSYRQEREMTASDFEAMAAASEEAGVPWFASVWDLPSLDYVIGLSPIALKAPSAALTDRTLMRALSRAPYPYVASTGMSTTTEIDMALTLLSRPPDIILHSVSVYPAPPKALNLRTIPMLSNRYGIDVGYSGHEVGIWPSLGAVALGAVMVERHVTLSRELTGADQACSLEPAEFAQLVESAQVLAASLGSPRRGLLEGERESRDKLRRSSLLH